MSLAKIIDIASGQRVLTADERAEHQKIGTRIHRALTEIRRFTRNGDAAALAKATARHKRATEARDAFIEKLGIADDHPAPPTHIRYVTRSPWHGNYNGAQVTGWHIHEVEMVLDHLDIMGPYYRTVRVLRDDGGPPRNPRSAPTAMGVAWFAVQEQIRSGSITPITTNTTGEPS